MFHIYSALLVYLEMGTYVISQAHLFIGNFGLPYLLLMQFIIYQLSPLKSNFKSQGTQMDFLAFY